MAEDFKQQLSFDDPTLHRMFLEIMRDVAREEIKQANLVRLLPAVVTAVDGGDGSLTINLNGDTVDISGILNRTGEVISPTDSVYIILINGSATNSVALIKK